MFYNVRAILSQALNASEFVVFRLLPRPCLSPWVDKSNLQQTAGSPTQEEITADFPIVKPLSPSVDMTARRFNCRHGNERIAVTPGLIEI